MCKAFAVFQVLPYKAHTMFKFQDLLGLAIKLGRHIGKASLHRGAASGEDESTW